MRSPLNETITDTSATITTVQFMLPTKHNLLLLLILQPQSKHPVLKQREAVLCPVSSTLALCGELLCRVPVLVAAEDVVGDVDVASGHMMDALGDGHVAGGTGGTGAHKARARTAAHRTNWGGTQRQGRRGACAPGKAERQYRSQGLEVRGESSRHHHRDNTVLYTHK